MNQASERDDTHRARRPRRVAVGGASVVTTLAVVLGVAGLRTRHDLRPVLALTPGAGITTSISSSATSAIPATLFPGVQRYLVYTVSNPLDVPIVVGALGIAAVSSPGGCPVANLDVSRAGFTGALVVPANGTNETEAPISLLDTNVNQNACQNVTFNFSYSGSAVYERTGGGGNEGIPTTTLAPATPNITRVAGGDRVLTAIAVSQHSFGNGLAASVVITPSDQYPDALAGEVVRDEPEDASRQADEDRLREEARLAAEEAQASAERGGVPVEDPPEDLFAGDQK